MEFRDIIPLKRHSLSEPSSGVEFITCRSGCRFAPEICSPSVPVGIPAPLQSRPCTDYPIAL